MLQLLFDIAKLGGQADRVLHAPTSEAWIDPWIEHGGANEAARARSTRSSIATGSDGDRCGVWPLREPLIFAPARALDRVRWRLLGKRRAPKPPLRVDAVGELEPTGPGARAMLGLGRLAARRRGR